MVNNLSMSMKRNGLEVANPKSHFSDKIINFKAVAKAHLVNFKIKLCYNGRILCYG